MTFSASALPGRASAIFPVSFRRAVVRFLPPNIKPIMGGLNESTVKKHSGAKLVEPSSFLVQASIKGFGEA